jgi:hypothetical protein
MKHCAPTVIELAEAVALVDARLEGIGARSVLTAVEVTDLLLDLRTSLVETAALEHLLATRGHLVGAGPSR